MVIQQNDVEFHRFRHILLEIIFLFDAEFADPFEGEIVEYEFHTLNHVRSWGRVLLLEPIDEQPTMEVDDCKLNLKVWWNTHQPLKLHGVAPMHHTQKVILNYPLQIVLTVLAIELRGNEFERQASPKSGFVDFVDQLQPWILALNLQRFEYWSEVAEFANRPTLPIFLNYLLYT